MHSNPFCTRNVRPGAIGFRFSQSLADEAELRRIVGEILNCSAAVIVGPHGSGKTTLLHALAPPLQSQFPQIQRILLHSPTCVGNWARYRQQRENAARVQNAARVLAQQRTARGNSLLIIDGIEQLSATSRWRILRGAKHHGHHLLATSHYRLRGMTTIHETSPDPQIIAALTAMLVEKAPPELRRAIQDELRRRRLSTVVNVRDLWFALYDVVASFPEQRAIHTLWGDSTNGNSTTAK